MALLQEHIFIHLKCNDKWLKMNAENLSVTWIVSGSTWRSVHIIRNQSLHTHKLFTEPQWVNGMVNNCAVPPHGSYLITKTYKSMQSSFPCIKTWAHVQYIDFIKKWGCTKCFESILWVHLIYCVIKLMVCGRLSLCVWAVNPRVFS